MLIAHHEILRVQIITFLLYQEFHDLRGIFSDTLRVADIEQVTNLKVACQDLHSLLSSFFHELCNLLHSLIREWSAIVLPHHPRSDDRYLLVLVLMFLLLLLLLIVDDLANGHALPGRRRIRLLLLVSGGALVLGHDGFGLFGRERVRDTAEGLGLGRVL